VDTDIFITMKKLAEATPEIGYISTWYRQGVPKETERIDSLVLALEYTTKVDGIEAIDPAVIKYLVGIGEIMSGLAKDARYLAGSECLTSPLILDHRSAADMLAARPPGCASTTCARCHHWRLLAGDGGGLDRARGGGSAGRARGAFCLDPKAT